jgi:hypothetical protein
MCECLQLKRERAYTHQMFDLKVRKFTIKHNQDLVADCAPTAHLLVLILLNT